MWNEFRRRLWQPPRAHGDVVEDRTVSFLELFHDLVYVVVIAAAARTIAHDITARSVAEFAVVFGLIWLAWMNGTFLHDLHGRNDVRTRFYTFVQMLLVALLAVYVGDSAGDGRRGFALVYTAYLALHTWLWYSVRRRDDNEQFTSISGQFLVRMVFSAAAMAASAFLPADARIVVWALLLLMWLATMIRLGVVATTTMPDGTWVSSSGVERFGLFVIIVLVGVVDGLSEAQRDGVTIATGVFALIIGFGLWWNYFDLTSGRPPRHDPSGSPIWGPAHLPLTLSIATAGASMVSLIEHAADERAPTSTAWLLAGSVALGLVSLVAIVRTLRDYDRLVSVYRPASMVMVAGAATALLIALWRPAPLILAIALGAIFVVTWLFAVTRWLATEESWVQTE